MKKIKLANSKPKRNKVEEKLDEVVRDIMRIRQNYTCQKCGKKHEPGTNQIQVSHYFGRTHRGTRWDFDNLDLLCGVMYYQKGRGWTMGSCHGEWEKEKNGAYMHFMKKKLGENKYNILEMKALGVSHFSIVDLMLMLEEMKKIREGLNE